jgi:hypothetical protein
VVNAVPSATNNHKIGKLYSSEYTEALKGDDVSRTAKGINKRQQYDSTMTSVHAFSIDLCQRR